MLVAVHQQALFADATQHVLPEVSGNAFRTVVPAEDSARTVHHVDPGLQGFEDVAEDVRVKQRHLSQGSELSIGGINVHVRRKRDAM
jgi:hypothetical protein